MWVARGLSSCVETSYGRNLGRHEAKRSRTSSLGGRQGFLLWPNSMWGPNSMWNFFLASRCLKALPLAEFLELQPLIGMGCGTPSLLGQNLGALSSCGRQGLDLISMWLHVADYMWGWSPIWGGKVESSWVLTNWRYGLPNVASMWSFLITWTWTELNWTQIEPNWTWTWLNLTNYMTQID